MAVGDYVILNWRACAGSAAPACAGQPRYCFATFNATQKMTLEDGTELSPALGIGAFLEKTLVTPGSAPRSTRPRRPPRPACSAAASWPASARRSTPAASAAATRSR